MSLPGIRGREGELVFAARSRLARLGINVAPTTALGWDGAETLRTRRILRFATGITFFRKLTLGLDAPYVMHQSGLNSPIIRAAAGIDTLKQSGFGDMRLTSKAGVWPQSGWRPGVALAMHLTLPTGNDAHLFGQGFRQRQAARSF